MCHVAHYQLISELNPVCRCRPTIVMMSFAVFDSDTLFAYVFDDVQALAWNLFLTLTQSSSQVLCTIV